MPVMHEQISIVDRGRGMQLSTSRITVQDLVPYFQGGCLYEEITKWIPSLTHDEIKVVEHYYRANQAQLDEEDRRIRERTEELIGQQRTKLPQFEGTRQERLARIKDLLKKRRQEQKGAGHSR